MLQNLIKYFDLPLALHPRKDASFWRILSKYPPWKVKSKLFQVGEWSCILLVEDAPQILCSAGVLESDYSKSLLFVDVENTVYSQTQ